MKAKNFFSLFVMALLFNSLSAINAYAKEINLFEQPTANSKVVAKIDLSAGLIPIFSSKDGTWTKVGDPRNGNVGWIKSADIKTGNGNAVTFTQRIITDGNKPQTYHIFQFGQPQLTEQQVKAMNERMLVQQKNMQKAMSDMMQSMDNVFKQQMNFFAPPAVVEKPAAAK